MRLMDGVIRARLTVFSDCDYASQDHTRRRPDTTGDEEIGQKTNSQTLSIYIYTNTLAIY